MPGQARLPPRQALPGVRGAWSPTREELVADEPDVPVLEIVTQGRHRRAAGEGAVAGLRPLVSLQGERSTPDRLDTAPGRPLSQRDTLLTSPAGRLFGGQSFPVLHGDSAGRDPPRISHAATEDPARPDIWSCSDAPRAALHNAPIMPPQSTNDPLRPCRDVRDKISSAGLGYMPQQLYPTSLEQPMQVVKRSMAAFAVRGPTITSFNFSMRRPSDGVASYHLPPFKIRQHDDIIQHKVLRYQLLHQEPLTMPDAEPRHRSTTSPSLRTSFFNYPVAAARISRLERIHRTDGPYVRVSGLHRKQRTSRRAPALTASGTVE